MTSTPSVTRPPLDSPCQWLFDTVTLGLCCLIGGIMALAYADIIPEVALFVGSPALAASMLVDTFLYNTFRIDTGMLVWGIIAVCVYLEALMLGGLVRAGHAWYMSTTDA